MHTLIEFSMTMLGYVCPANVLAPNWCPRRCSPGLVPPVLAHSDRSQHFITRVCWPKNVKLLTNMSRAISARGKCFNHAPFKPQTFLAKTPSRPHFHELWNFRCWRAAGQAWKYYNISRSVANEILQFI